MANLIFWYLAIALAGWLVFPLAYRLLAFLPDRGLALARPLGLLLWGYIYWLLVSFGVLQNNPGGVLLALLLIGGLSLGALWVGERAAERRSELLGWLRDRRGLVIATELIFLALFAAWAVVRASNPDATGTEKPMELAFINAILRSPAFPPSDPWLSGYAISYYYFGYVMVAMLAKFSGTPGSVAFNLALASWFALSGLGAYGLLYNLLAVRGRQIAGYVQSLFAPVLAPLFLLIVSNLEGFLEILHAKGLGWQMDASGQAVSSVWSWLNIQELVNPPALPYVFEPNRPGGIWWWRASRVLQDFDLNNGSREIIDEFPAFSYLLGDLHPHVLSMPFVLLAIGLAFNVYLRLRDGESGGWQISRWFFSLEFWLAALILGGLSFLNTWDFPIYLALFAAAVTLARLAWTGWRWELLYIFLGVLISVLIAGVLLYLPFYLGFSSQANGLLPSLVFFTRGVYLWIMFGSLLLPILAWLVWMTVCAYRSGRIPALKQGFLLAGALLAGLYVLSLLLGVKDLIADPGLVGIWGAQSIGELLVESLTRRITSPGTWISLLVLLALVWGLLQGRLPVVAADATVDNPVETPDDAESANHADPYALLMVLLGLGLVVFPEFFYLRDQFGWRMNTIFKFYYQAWIVWSVIAAYASVVLLRELRRAWPGIVYSLALVALLAVALIYPLYGVWDRTSKFNPQVWSLDGAHYMARYQPDEMAAINWLQSAPYGTVVEAVGGSYTGYARVSLLSGLPAVLGWPGHEGQWRGGGKEMGSRQTDIEQLYHARTWNQLSPLLQKYNIRYVYLGSLEQSTYRPDPAVFQQNLKTVFQTGQVAIYEVPQNDLTQGQAVEP